MLVKMPKQRNSKNRTTKTTTTSGGKHQPTTPLRRSQRLILQKLQDPNTHNLRPKNNHKDCPKNASKKPTKPNQRSIICAVPAPGWRKFPSLRNGVNEVSGLRRSPRLSLLGNANKLANKSGDDKSKRSRDGKSEKFIDFATSRSVDDNSKDNKGVLLNKVKGEVGVDSPNEVVKRSERRPNRIAVGVEVVIGLQKAKGRQRDACERGEEIRINRKRKRGAETDEGSVKGWTKEQEMALQRAYFVARPTPNFWKQVSKLVPGKSAQDCFDKIHSNHLTPPQPLPRSRVKRTNSLPLDPFSLSASKLLNPCGLNVKRLSFNKQKTHLAQRTVRELLQKHNHMDQDYEADLFSILEPNMNPSTQDSQLNVVLSTPKHLQEKQGSLQKSRERSSSGHKKPLSRFSRSCRIDLASPPVLKQVKNRVLHEKYIDQLHCREAKRKAASAQATKSITGKESRVQINVQKIDVVRAAKNALVSDVRDAINQLQHLQANAVGNSSDFDDDGVDNDNVEGENGP